MDTKDHSFLIIEALVSKTGAFELIRGYERTDASTAMQAEEVGGDITIHLLDHERAPLSSLSPPVRYPNGCMSPSSKPGVAYLHTAIVRHSEARFIQLTHGEQLLFESSVGVDRPRSSDVKVDVKDGQAIISTEENASPEHLWLGVRTKDGAVLRPQSTAESGSYSIDLDQLAGLGSASVILEWTQEFRTSRFVSQSFDLPDAQIQGVIIEPSNGSTWRFGHRGSLMASLYDQNGRPKEWKDHEVKWIWNGQEIDKGTQLTSWYADKKGSHALQLVLKTPEGELKILDEVIITVNEPTDGQIEYFERLKNQNPVFEIPEDACVDQ